MTSVPRILLFDIDGTLIDSGGAGSKALLQALIEEFALQTAEMVALHGRTDFGVFAELLERHELDVSDENRLRLFERYAGNLPVYMRQAEGRVLPGVRELLDAVDGSSNFVVGVLTGNMPATAQTKLAHFELEKYFRFGIYGDSVPHRPMLRDIALSTVASICETLALPCVDSSRIVIIGDTPLDIELAKSMQSRALAVETGGFSREALLAAGADHVVSDLSEVQAVIDWFVT